MNLSHYKSQRGATLIIGLIMLVTLTLIVSTAFTLSGSNLKSVRNMQLRNEAIAAANSAIEQVISSPFTNSPAAETISVDINKDGKNDFDVAISTPVCMRASIASNGQLSSLSLPVTMTSAGFWNTVWDIDATATDTSSGTSVHVRSGTRVKLDDTQKSLVCP